MPMKLITAREKNGSYIFRVHTDPAKVVDGEPDPVYVEEYVFGTQRPEGVNKSDYLENCKREARLLAELARDQRKAARVDSPGTKLAFEGEDI